ncbi:MAG: DUF2213 domain-containing protein [Eubacterium sp.]|nr:DUF2213 domain-containing protein [Eubacterium sp.]
MPSKLTKVVRLDNLPIGRAYFTAEGYLIDKPILTSTGIFEYANDDGTVRYELRLPDEVFAEESLKSYKGKPVIITHDAEYVTKDNVQGETIGAIMSDGYQDGSNVRAEIVIHDTDAMKKSGLKELSLGYDLDLDETPGEWNGQHYDAIQRNIRINHLALVEEARAGDRARLNIDSRGKKTILRGGKAMGKKSVKTTRRKDGILTPDELTQAIVDYKKRRAERLAAKADEENDIEKNKGVGTNPDPANADGEIPEEEIPAVKSDDVEEKSPDTVEEAVEIVKDRRDRRDEQGDPKTIEEATGVIAHQDEDISSLIDIIDTLLAEREFNAAAKTDADDDPEENVPPKQPIGKNETDGDDSNLDPEEKLAGDCDDPINKDDDEDEETLGGTPIAPKSVNADSVDKIIRQRVKIGMVGRMLNLDGLEDMSIIKAKKTVIRAVRPGIRLDGKSAAYIDAAFDCAADEINRKSLKDTSYQKRQMFNTDGRSSRADETTSMSARERMIARQRHSKKEGK